MTIGQYASIRANAGEVVSIKTLSVDLMGPVRSTEKCYHFPFQLFFVHLFYPLLAQSFSRQVVQSVHSGICYWKGMIVSRLCEFGCIGFISWLEVRWLVRHRMPGQLMFILHVHYCVPFQISLYKSASYACMSLTFSPQQCFPRGRGKANCSYCSLFASVHFEKSVHVWCEPARLTTFLNWRHFGLHWRISLILIWLESSWLQLPGDALRLLIACRAFE